MLSILRPYSEFEWGIVHLDCQHFGCSGASLDCSQKVDPDSTFGETQPNVTGANLMSNDLMLQIIVRALQILSIDKSCEMSGVTSNTGVIMSI